MEPIYGKTYLPRKFKIVRRGAAVERRGRVYAHDLGYIAILGGDGKVIEGWNVTAGGGMGMTHGVPETYPRTADVMGFIAEPTRRVRVAEAVRHRAARLGRPDQTASMRGSKYTIEDRGARRLPRPRCERRSGVTFEARRVRSCSSSPATVTAGARAQQASHLDAVRAERPAQGFSPGGAQCR